MRYRTACPAPIVAFALLFAVGPAPAAAHGDASWIMNHPKYGWCCGPEDCVWLEAKEVRVVGDHYVADRQGIRWPILGSYPSADNRYWACYFMRGSVREELKCFFAPARAM